MTWHTIETAPTTGVFVPVKRNDGREYTARFTRKHIINYGGSMGQRTYYNAWVGEDDRLVPLPTHWRIGDD